MPCPKCFKPYQYEGSKSTSTYPEFCNCLNTNINNVDSKIKLKKSYYGYGSEINNTPFTRIFNT
jgi:hypothetical protein